MTVGGTVAWAGAWTEGERGNRAPAGIHYGCAPSLPRCSVAAVPAALTSPQ